MGLGAFAVFYASGASTPVSSAEGEWELSTVHIVGIALYAALLIPTIIMYVFKRCKYSLPCMQLSTIFYIGLPVFIVLRIIWFILELNTTDGASLAGNLINRLSFCVFMFVFNALLFYWIDTVHTTVNVAFAKEAFSGSLDYEFITHTGRFFFWLATGIVVLLTLVLAIVRAVLIGTADKAASDYSSMKHTIETIYDVNNIIISLMFLVYGLCFFIYGTTLICRIKRNKASSGGDLVKAEIFSVTLMVCFAIRCVMFSYRIMTGNYLPINVYIVLSYFVPELIPSIMCLWSLNMKMFDNSDANKTFFTEGVVDEPDGI